jgi:ribosomal protein S8E
MSIEITHIRLSGGSGHEYITDYKWRNLQSGETGESNKPAMVEWVDKPANHAYVGSGVNQSEAGVVRPQYGQPYLRTYADGVWNNNLLALPRF